MSYLLDTNVLSELHRKAPDARVVDWFAQRPAGTLYLSVLTLGEIRKSIEALRDPPRRLSLLDWLETELPAFFSGRPLPAIDSLLAATAAQHGLIFVIRNLRDAQGVGVQALNPWDD